MFQLLQQTITSPTSVADYYTALASISHYCQPWRHCHKKQFLIQQCQEDSIGQLQ